MEIKSVKKTNLDGDLIGFTIEVAGTKIECIMRLSIDKLYIAGTGFRLVETDAMVMDMRDSLFETVVHGLKAFETFPGPV